MKWWEKERLLGEYWWRLIKKKNFDPGLTFPMLFLPSECLKRSTEMLSFMPTHWKFISVSFGTKWPFQFLSPEKQTGLFFHVIAAEILNSFHLLHDKWSKNSPFKELPESKTWNSQLTVGGRESSNGTFATLPYIEKNKSWRVNELKKNSHWKRRSYHSFAGNQMGWKFKHVGGGKKRKHSLVGKKTF